MGWQEDLEIVQQFSQRFSALDGSLEVNDLIAEKKALTAERDAALSRLVHIIGKGETRSLVGLSKAAVLEIRNKYPTDRPPLASVDPDSIIWPA